MMRHCLTLALVVCSRGLGAQETTRAVPDSGAWVRYVLPPSAAWHTGRVLGREGRLIRVRLNQPGVEELVSLDSMQRLQLAARRPRSQGAERGALIGLLTGVSASLIALLSVRDECMLDCGMPVKLAVGMVGVVGTAGLTAGGAIIGAAAPGIVWQPEAAPRQASGPRDTRLRLAISLPFR